MAKVTPIERFSAEIESILQEYEQDVNSNMNDAVVAAGKSGVKAIRASARSDFKTHNKKNPYAKSWRVKNEEIGAGKIVSTIYSTKPGLPHLLEFGHAKRGGGRVEGRAHIKPVEEKLIESFEGRVRMEL